MSAPASQHPKEPDSAGDINAALEGFIAASPERSRRDAALLLVAACVVAVALDSEGLLSWARRLEVGPAQAVLLRGLVPLHDALSKVGVAAPRRWVSGAREKGARALGSGGDPLLAEGWVPVAPSAPNALVPPPSPPLVEAVPQEAARSGGVLLLGDSMIAGSLGALLERTLQRGTGLDVVRAAQLGTGLARPEVYDWMKVVPALLQREGPRFVVVSLGANDGTNLLEGAEQLDFGEPRWRQVYAARVEAMMRALAGSHARVLWLTLPPMRDQRLSARAALLNRIFVQSARRVPRVELLEMDVLVGDGERRYATFVQARDGRLLRYRLDDGVHLAPAGSRAVAGWVLDWLRERRWR